MPGKLLRGLALISLIAGSLAGCDGPDCLEEVETQTRWVLDIYELRDEGVSGSDFFVCTPELLADPSAGGPVFCGYAGAAHVVDDCGEAGSCEGGEKAEVEALMRGALEEQLKCLESR